MITLCAGCKYICQKYFFTLQFELTSLLKPPYKTLCCFFVDMFLWIYVDSAHMLWFWELAAVCGFFDLAERQHCQALRSFALHSGSVKETMTLN